MEKKKSIGIRLVGVIFLALGVLSTPAYIMLQATSYDSKGLMLLFTIIMSIIIIGMPIISLFSGIGLLLLKKWGRICAIITATVISLVLCGYGISGLVDTKANLMNTFFFLLVFYSVCFIGALSFALIIFYLTRPKVKEQFK